MSKLGYTWYPKDWGNSEKVFELTLEQRGLYRELIDMAMLNDNKTVANYKVWARKFNCDIDDLVDCMQQLSKLELIEFITNEIDEPNLIFIPSCEPRLNLIRGGKKGGKTSKKNKPIIKPTQKPNDKPMESLDEINDKPTHNQIEIETKLKEREKVLHPLEKLELKKDEDLQEWFLDWFNKHRTRLLEIPSNFKKLQSNDIYNLTKLNNTYNEQDFEKALKSICMDKWACENDLVIPKHFLNEDNFVKYLNATPKHHMTREQKKRKGWTV